MDDCRLLLTSLVNCIGAARVPPDLFDRHRLRLYAHFLQRRPHCTVGNVHKSRARCHGRRMLSFPNCDRG